MFHVKHSQQGGSQSKGGRAKGQAQAKRGAGHKARHGIARRGRPAQNTARARGPNGARSGLGRTQGRARGGGGHRRDDHSRSRSPKRVPEHGRQPQRRETSEASTAAHDATAQRDWAPQKPATSSAGAPAARRTTCDKARRVAAGGADETSGAPRRRGGTPRRRGGGGAVPARRDASPTGRAKLGAGHPTGGAEFGTGPPGRSRHRGRAGRASGAGAHSRECFT